jgi:desulfoferrodoxin-like iron-binding protein
MKNIYYSIICTRKEIIMTEKLELYKCSICGNLVQVLLSGVGELICCNQPMEKLCPKINEDNELSAAVAAMLTEASS